jgi:competence protein ComGC
MHTCRCRPRPTARRALTLIDWWWLIAVLALLISILLPSLSRARAIAKRTVCASNLGGIGAGMHIYANDNDDWFPNSLYREAKAGGGNDHEVQFITHLSRDLERATTSANDTTVHPSRSLFLLVISGTCTTKQFVCPSSDDAEDDLRNRGPRGATASQPGVNRFDFRGYPYLSYGYQMPFGTRAKPNENLDPRMPVMADKGPFYEAGEEGPSGNRFDRAKGEPGSPLSVARAKTGVELLQIETGGWRPYNSRNHNGEGQEVMYSDGHVDFERRPIVGVNYDNIYTQQNGYSFENSLLGLLPADKKGPWTNTDTLIIP